MAKRRADHTMAKRRADHTMAKRKRTKGQTMMYKNTTQETKDRVIRTLLNIRGELRCSGWVGSSCSICGTRRVTIVTNPMIMRKRPYYNLIQTVTLLSKIMITSGIFKLRHHWLYSLSVAQLACTNMKKNMH